MTQLMKISLTRVEADPNQPRKHFEKAAMDELETSMQCLGQLTPIRVRKDDAGRFVIVDGERRWRTLCTLNKAYPDDERFAEIEAFEGKAFDQDPNTRKAVQLLSNSTGRDLAPTEKALLIRDLRAESGAISDKEMEKKYGFTKGQLRHLTTLGNAPPFIQALGLPQKLEVLMDGANTRVKRECPPLGVSLLAELLTLHNKLLEVDKRSLEQASKGDRPYRPIASLETKRLGETAQSEMWSKAQLQKRCAALVERYTMVEKKPTVPPLASTVAKLGVYLEKALAREDRAAVSEAAQQLRALLVRIETARLSEAA